MPQGRYIITVYLKDNGEEPQVRERTAIAEEVEKLFNYNLPDRDYGRIDFVTITWDRVWTVGDSS